MANTHPLHYQVDILLEVACIKGHSLATILEEMQGNMDAYERANCTHKPLEITHPLVDVAGKPS
jgi:hypothetical protein